MSGDEHGDLNLDKALTRAELTCLISPIVLNLEHVAWEKDRYTRMCTTNFPMCRSGLRWLLAYAPPWE